MSKKKLIAIISLTALVTFFITFLVTAAVCVSVFLKSDADKYKKLDKIKSLIDKYYYEEYDESKLVEGAAKGMVDSLGDPYSTYMDKDEWDDFKVMLSGSYSGLGITVAPNEEDNTIIVISAFDGSPAKEAGITTGDKIIEVFGETVTGDKLDDAVAKMKGEPGTEVEISVLKADSGEIEELTLKRQNITMNSVSSRMEGNLGYIQISMFDVNTGKEFKEHLDSVVKSGAKGLIIDLRQNGGGITTACEQVADALLDKNKVIYYTQNKKGEEVYHKTKKDGIDLPMVVLIDEGTASASEILSAALRDNGKAVLVGKKSFGKGLVQQTVELGDGSMLKVTVERYFTPGGTDINKKGIEPDYDVELTEDGTTDKQLEKAKEILGN